MYGPYFFTPTDYSQPPWSATHAPAVSFTTHMPLRPPAPPTQQFFRPASSIPILTASGYNLRPGETSQRATSPPDLLAGAGAPVAPPYELVAESLQAPPSYKLQAGTPERILLLAPPPRYRACTCHHELAEQDHVFVHGPTERGKRVADIVTTLLIGLNLVVWSLVIWGYLGGFDGRELTAGADDLAGVTFLH